MGVLDDAIRQHIELKRQHGASEDELERKAQEALGPARREVAPEGEGETDGEDAGVEDAPSGDSRAIVGDPAAAAEPEREAFDEQPTRIVSPAANEQAPADHAADDWLEPDDEPDVPAPAGSASAAPAGDDEPEDVLEETPEFLQETPEHDRLWFEQKPPRDFDFDDK